MRTGLAALLILFAIGCGGSADRGSYASGHAEQEEASTNPTVERAVKIAKAIDANPDAAEEILEEHGLTVEQFERMMYDISIDPALSKAYKAARE